MIRTGTWLVLALTVPSGLHAMQFPDLEGRSHANRVDYGVNSRGEIGSVGCCSHSPPGLWPRGTANAYMFNSGLQVSGIIGGSRPANPWAGDTTGALFYDPSGLRQHGTGVTQVWNWALPARRAQWPEAARVPSDARFADALHGAANAGDADAWWMSWEGDPALNAARPHPLGVAAEHRVMGWNAPRGNEDILYVMVTVHNVTARDPAVYAAHRPGLREELMELGERFHELNEEEFGVDLPDAGYVIDPLHLALVADPDVTSSAGTNFASVNLPLAMGFAWHRDFIRASGWTFGADLHSTPFFAGSGFVGMPFLGTPDGSGRILLYSNPTNGGQFPDPNSAVRAFKYHSATITPADGVACNHGDPLQSGICYIGNVNASDVRLMQSTRAVRLAPGESVTLVYAYVHAAPVAIPGYAAPSPVLPGDPLRLATPSQVQLGANRIDSIAGFLGWQDANGDGVVQGREFRAVPRSLIGKAQLAQAFFDNRFATPLPPEAPPFFLVPGDNRVTVMWQRSPTETLGDPYFAIARDASVVPSGGGAPVPNPLYDPNYREFDVEGYRIWRGRSSDPGAMELVAQFDHSGTVFRDHTAQVQAWNSPARCAPELDYTDGCPDRFDVPAPGKPLVRADEHDIYGAFTQVMLGDRVVLPNGEVLLLATDTAVVGGASGMPELVNSGVPFLWVDQSVRNGLTYHYAVTAFDVNSITSTGRGRTSLSSAMQPRAVRPRTAAPAEQVSARITQGVFGRSGMLADTTWPTINPSTGRFSKRFPVASGVTVEPIAVALELLAGTQRAGLRFDSITVQGVQSNGNVDATHHFTVMSAAGESRIAVPITHPGTTSFGSASGMLDLLATDPARVAMHGGEGTYRMPGSWRVYVPGLYFTSLWVRGCVNGAYPFPFDRTCWYNGPRWFQGSQEMVDHPNRANAGTWSTGIALTDFDNTAAGRTLDEVRRAHLPLPYETFPTTYRDIAGILGVHATNGEYRVYWGDGGAIDSVIDLVHDVEIPFSPRFGSSWGILNAEDVPAGISFDGRSELTAADIGCVEPIFRIRGPQFLPCTTEVPLSRRAVPGTVAFSAGTASYDHVRTAPAAGKGFLLYLMGHPMLFEMEHALPPASGSQWTLRTYVGVVSGGQGAAGDLGPYAFQPAPFIPPIPMVTPGARFEVEVEVERTAREIGEQELARVHPVPDPYYRTAGNTPEEVRFVNLPARATLRIYSSSGVLVRVLRHDDAQGGGEVAWDLRSREGRAVASGVYLYHVAAEGAAAVGRMVVVR